MTTTRIAAHAAVALFLCACAPEVVRQPASLAAGNASPTAYTLEHAVSFDLASGYSRSLAAGTRLVAIGTIAEGRVLKPTNTVFSVEGAQVHEAYLVVRGTKLAGFYLPVERAFSPLTTPIDLSLKESNP